MKIFYIFVLIGLVFSCSPENEIRVLGDNHSLLLNTNPVTFPENTLFSFEFELNNYVAGLRPEVDCTMPDHGHGMNTQTKIIDLGQGKFRVEGMQLHMPGEWLLHIDIFDDEKQIEKFRYKFRI